MVLLAMGCRSSQEVAEDAASSVAVVEERVVSDVSAHPRAEASANVFVPAVIPLPLPLAPGAAAVAVEVPVPTRRSYLQLDKSVYRAGDTIQAKAWEVDAPTLRSTAAGEGFTFALVGEDVSLRVPQARGTADGGLALPPGLAAGAYVVRATAPDGLVSEREIVVAQTMGAGLVPTLELVRESYAPGDTVTSMLTLAKGDGTPVAEARVHARIAVDGRALPEVPARTGVDGTALLRCALPRELDGDAMLTVRVQHEGLEQTLSRRVPLLREHLELAFFPEGGALVELLPSRVYVSAHDGLGQPTAVEGEVLDARGQAITSFTTDRRGRGRFSMIPTAGQTYVARVRRPQAADPPSPLPVPRSQGCTLRTEDDVGGVDPAITAAIRCSEARGVVVVAILREHVLAVETVVASREEDAIVRLESDAKDLRDAMGVARVVVLATDLSTLAERVVFVNRNKGLHIEVAPKTAVRTSAGTFDLVVTTRDASGRPIPAEVALSVVGPHSGTVRGHLPSAILLEPEIADAGPTPSVYFDPTRGDSALALELWMGTQGPRRDEPPTPVHGEGAPIAPRTVRWEPKILTGETGEATVSVELPSEFETLHVLAEGTAPGLLGSWEHALALVPPFDLDVALPEVVTEGDALAVPLTIHNALGRDLAVVLTGTFAGPWRHPGSAAPNVERVGAGRDARLYFAVEVTGARGRAGVTFAAQGEGFDAKIDRDVEVVPRGYPRALHASGLLGSKGFSHEFRGDLGRGETTRAELTVFPSPLSTIVHGADRLAQGPSGDPEATCHRVGADLLVLAALERADAAAPSVLTRVKARLAAAYPLLVASSFPDASDARAPDARRSACLLLRLVEMRRGYRAVEDEVIDRVLQAVLAQRDGAGGFLGSPARDGATEGDAALRDAEIVDALARAGFGVAIQPELAALRERSAQTSDPHLLAVAIHALRHARGEEAAAKARLERLVAMQGEDGAWGSTERPRTITETTALALLAVAHGGDPKVGRRAIAWLAAHRVPGGGFGTPRATLLVLEALMQHATLHPGPPAAGEVHVVLQGGLGPAVAYGPSVVEPIVLDLGASWSTGDEVVQLRHVGVGEPMFALEVERYGDAPTPDPDAPFAFATTLVTPRLQLGQTALVLATITNRTDSEQPTAMARIGLPSGLVPAPWQLEALRDQGVVHDFATGPREVVLFWSAVAGGETRQVRLELLAHHPGRFLGPPSSVRVVEPQGPASWAPGVAVTIDP